MSPDDSAADATLAELVEIKSLLQTLVIIQGAGAGLTRDQVRQLTGLQTKTVSEIWGSLKKQADE